MPSLHYPNDLCSKSQRELFCRCGPNRGKGIFSVHACSDFMSYRFLITTKSRWNKVVESLLAIWDKTSAFWVQRHRHTHCWTLPCRLCLRVYWTLYVSQEQCTGHTRVKWITHNDSCCRLFLRQRGLLTLPSGRVTINFASSARDR